MIKEEIIFSKNINKIYAIAKEKNYSLVIKKNPEYFLSFKSKF